MFHIVAPLPCLEKAIGHLCTTHRLASINLVSDSDFNGRGEDLKPRSWMPPPAPTQTQGLLAILPQVLILGSRTGGGRQSRQARSHAGKQQVVSSRVAPSRSPVLLLLLTIPRPPPPLRPRSPRPGARTRTARPRQASPPGPPGSFAWRSSLASSSATCPGFSAGTWADSRPDRAGPADPSVCSV